MDPARRYKAEHPDFVFDTIAHLPFANIAGIDMYCTNPIYMGGSTYWMKNYEYNSFIEHHRKYRPAYQFTVPPIWLRIAKDDNVTDDGKHVWHLWVARLEDVSSREEYDDDTRELATRARGHMLEVES